MRSLNTETTTSRPASFNRFLPDSPSKISAKGCPKAKRTPNAPEKLHPNSLRRVSSLLSEGGATIACPRTSTNQHLATATRIIATATATTTPTRTTTSTRSSQRLIPLSSASRRAPLAPRDQNALSVTRPRSATSAVGKPSAMPFEKGPNANARQPQTPSLSAAAVKAMNRTPLTPKIASKPLQGAPLATPLGRRNRGDNIASPYTVPVSGGLKDECISPVASFLNSNITPRSGSRQSRVESANSTPTGTPVLDRQDGWDARSGLGISASGAETDHLRKQAVTFSPASDIGSTPRHDAPSPIESRFFYASDTKGTHQCAQPKPIVSQARTPTFFYANGNSVQGSKPSSVSGVAVSPAGGQAGEAPSSKFVYANGIPDLQPTFKTTTSSGPGSVVSAASRITTARTTASTPAGAHPFVPRPASPKKMASQPSLASVKSFPQTPVSGTRSPMLNVQSQGVTAPGPFASAPRRVSIDTTPRAAYQAPPVGVQIADPPAIAKVLTSLPSSEASSPSSVSNRAMTMASLIQAAEDLAPTDESRTEEGNSDVQSPTKSTQGNDQLSDLVANARRERKVQDLEITNASLEAINRTLERQLRKQTAELRRFRRLSRSGRFSLASTASSILPPDSVSGVSGIDTLGLSDLSEEESEEDENSMDESEVSESDSASTSEGPSPISKTARDARRRTRDERRLQLDLSKHRELLIDSQKINQSLKRCLNWTEELIKDGRKALAYQVRVSDVELGGRVLAPPDEDEDTSHSGDEREASSAVMGELDGEIIPTWSKEPQDRDSGIELPAS